MEFVQDIFIPLILHISLDQTFLLVVCSLVPSVSALTWNRVTSPGRTYIRVCVRMYVCMYARMYVCIFF